jgi:protein-S-isoprenylcysteine O-methyltransferase Ste14
MDADNRDGAEVWLPPPLVYLGALIVGILLHSFVLPFPVRPPLSLRILLGLGAVLLGLAMMAGTVRSFRRTGQDPKPWQSTPEIIASGVYRFTRNPMYVSMALLQLGIGIGLANGWVIALVLPVLVIIYATAIRHEEAYLERKFGGAYVQYKATVRRWL